MSPLPTTRHSCRRSAELALALSACCFLAACASSSGRNRDNPDWAQAGSPPPPTVTASDAEWKETDVPPPPAFAESRAIAIDVQGRTELKFSIDPATIAITKDGVVRYVVVASSGRGGATNAYYEGVRCSTEEVKTYARFNDGKWDETVNAEWKPYRQIRSGYVRQLTYQGLCRGHGTQVSVQETVQMLRKPVREVE
nr:CNP1-like family protein [Variovorax sp. dw_308]